MSVDEAIKLFEKEEIQIDIEKSLHDQTLSYLSIDGIQNNPEELFNNIIDSLDSYASTLNLAISTGNIKKKNINK